MPSGVSLVNKCFECVQQFVSSSRSPKTDSWNHVPKGCSYETRSGAGNGAHFNTGEGGNADQDRRGGPDFQPLCKKRCRQGPHKRENLGGTTRWAKHFTQSDCDGKIPDSECCRKRCMTIQKAPHFVTHYVFSPQKGHNYLCWCKTMVDKIVTKNYPDREGYDPARF